MSMEFRTSDMELMANANRLITSDEYKELREKYKSRDPRKYVGAGLHRNLMEQSIAIAKHTIDGGGSEDEVKRACLYLYICMDARKYRLAWNKAKRDYRIDELVSKYMPKE